MSRGSSSSTHRTHEVHARRQDGRGRVFARDATRPASLDGPVERSPSRSRRHPRSTRLRAAVPETAQRFLLLFFSSPSVLRCSSGECGLTTNIALPNSQTRARVSPPPFAGPSSERDEHPSASALAEWRLRRGAHPPSMAEPTRLLCREKRNASKAKRLNPEPLPISEPLKSPHLKRRSAAPPRETLRVSLGGYAPRRGGFAPSRRRARSVARLVQVDQSEGEGEMEVVSCDRSSQPARRAPDVWPCPPPPGSRAAVMHTLPSLHPRSYTTSPGPTPASSSIVSTIFCGVALIGYEILVTNRVAKQPNPSAGVLLTPSPRV